MSYYMRTLSSDLADLSISGRRTHVSVPADFCTIAPLPNHVESTWVFEDSLKVFNPICKESVSRLVH